MLKWLLGLFGRKDGASKASPEKENIKRLISQHERRLHILKEQQANPGQPMVPPHILIEIEDVEAEIRRLESGLEDENYGGRDRVEAVIKAHQGRLQKLKKLEANLTQQVSSEEIAAIELEIQRLQAELKSK